MHTISIQTDSYKLLEALKAVLALDPKAIFTHKETDNTDDYELNRADEIKLKEIYEKNKRGELKFYSDDEISKSLAAKGYQW